MYQKYVVLEKGYTDIQQLLLFNFMEQCPMCEWFAVVIFCCTKREKKNMKKSRTKKYPE